jgi:lysyl-tRNA synthetase class 2
MEDKTSLQQIINFRKEKLKELIANGVNPFPSVYNPTQTSLEILTQYETFESESVCLAGRIMSMRKMGKACFCHIQDQHGRIQLYIKQKAIPILNYVI